MKKIQEFNGFIGAEGVETNTLFCSQIATKGLTFSIKDDTYAEVTGYTGNAKHVYIPDFWNGYPVTVIGEGAFENAEIVTVRTPKYLEGVGRNAFNNCINLKEIELGESILTIGEYAFNNCPALEKMIVKATTYPSDSSNSYNFGIATPTLYRPAVVTDLSKWESLEGAGFILEIINHNVNASSATNTSFTNKPFVDIYILGEVTLTAGTYQIRMFVGNIGGIEIGSATSMILEYDGLRKTQQTTNIGGIGNLLRPNYYVTATVSANGVLSFNFATDDTPVLISEIVGVSCGYRRIN